MILLFILIPIIIFGILGLFVISYLFIGQPYAVSGQAMQPNYDRGAYLFVQKVFKNITRGSVVVYQSPVDTDAKFLHRIVGLPEEKIMVKEEHVYINGQILSEPYLSNDTLTQAGEFLKEGETLTVPPDNVVVMGDNRQHSFDSRALGLVPERNIIGNVLFCYANCK